MAKKSNSRQGIEIISHSKIIGFALLLAVFLVSCNNAGKSTDKKDSVSTSRDTTTQPSDIPDLDWLVHWGPIPFTSDANDNAGIEHEKQGIRVYVRGWLAEYNADPASDSDDPRKPYIVSRFVFDRVTTSPLSYKVQAFLRPPAKEAPHHADEPGGHLQPPSPPPPR